ncbi:MAG: cyanase, partial [Stellaceae bacterium]
MTRDELTAKIIATKRAKGLSWKTIVGEIGGGSAVYLTAALLGQMKLRPEQAERAAKLFGLDRDETLLLQEIPYRGSLPSIPPTDPVIYRFFEVLQVYGTTWKQLIQE